MSMQVPGHAGTMQKLQGPCIVEEPVKLPQVYRLKRWVKKAAPVKRALQKIWGSILPGGRHSRRLKRTKRSFYNCAVARPPPIWASTISFGSHEFNAPSIALAEAGSSEEEEEEVRVGDASPIEGTIDESERLVAEGNQIIAESNRLVVDWHRLVGDARPRDESSRPTPRPVYPSDFYARHPTAIPPHTFLQNRASHHQARCPVFDSSLDTILEYPYQSLNAMLASMFRDESSSDGDISPQLMARESESTHFIQPSNTATPAGDSPSEQAEEKEAASSPSPSLSSRSPSLSPATASRRYGMFFPASTRASILPGSGVFDASSTEATASRSPSASRPSSVRRYDGGSRIPRPVPFYQAFDDSNPCRQAESTSSDSDDSKSTVKARTAIPVRIQRENNSARLIPQDNQSTFHTEGARLVSVTQSSNVSQTSGQTSTAVPSDLDIISEKASSRTSVETPPPSVQPRMGPTLRISSVAERFLRGSRSVSFAKHSEAHKSGKAYYPRMVRGDTPPSDEDDDSLRQETSPLQTKQKSVRSPPRAQSLNALSEVAAQQAAPAAIDAPVLRPGSKHNVSFDDLVTHHPEVKDVVIKSGVVKVPPPRKTRVFDSIRSALSLGRAERRGQTSFLIQEKRPRSSLPRLVLPSTPPPATPEEMDRALEKARKEERPVARSGRPGLMPSIDQVRAALNAVGRALVNSESRESRKELHREFVNLHTLLVQYEVFKDRSDEAVNEAGARREAMLRAADEMWKRHEDLDCEGVSSKVVTAEL